MVNKNIKLSAAFAVEKDAGIAHPEKPSASDTGLPRDTASKQNPSPKPLRQAGASIATTLQTDMTAKMEGQGKTGTLNYGGYFAEEYLGQIKGRGGVLIYDEMRRGDYQFAAVLRNIIA